MLHLRVVREPSDAGATLGSLYVNDVWQCWTLEDAIREPLERPAPDMPLSVFAQWVRTWKIAGRTAIPAGLYGVRMTLSGRFKTTLPEIINVPGFAGIRIHAGNQPDDTEGCLLVGRLRVKNGVLESQLALRELQRRLERAADAKDPIVIDFENPPARYLTRTGGLATSN